MAEKTLYDILEVSETASYETIRAAYERLSKVYSPDGAHAYSASDAAIRYTAVKEAFFTLGNTEKRAAYDRKLHAAFQAPATASAFGTRAKLLFVAAMLVGAIGGYTSYKSKQEQIRFTREAEIAAERAREAEQLARAESERANAEAAQRQAKILEDRQRRERDVSLARFQHEQRVREVESRIHTDRERILQDRATQQRRHEEAQAARIAVMRAHQERAELCRLERQRYGRSISC